MCSLSSDKNTVFMKQEESNNIPLRRKVNLQDIEYMTFSCTYRIFEWREGNPAQARKRKREKKQEIEEFQLCDKSAAFNCTQP